jgi:UDP-N-acetylmuramoylalanine--D-glutamate ligase
MFPLENKEILVIGLGGRGRAACELLCRCGAKVFAVDSADTADLREKAQLLRALGVEVCLGTSSAPRGNFSLAVLSPAVPMMTPLVQAVINSQVQLISELELGYQQTRCLAIVIAGTNGKGTTAGLVERILLNNHRKAVVSGHRARPICSVVNQTHELDFLILQVKSFQLRSFASQDYHLQRDRPGRRSLSGSWSAPQPFAQLVRPPPGYGPLPNPRPA